MVKQKIFLASSSELIEDRREFEIFINRKNKDWIGREVFLQLIVWEDFLDAMSKTRLQDEYNKVIRECDIFVLLCFTKVGRYTQEEFETAFGQFQATGKPFIFTYFKDAEISTANVDLDALISRRAFQEKLSDLGHFYTNYEATDGLLHHFNRQLDKLAEDGFIKFAPHAVEPETGNANTEARLDGSGAVAQGDNATAVGAGGVNVGGNNSGTINTGNQTLRDVNKPR